MQDHRSEIVSIDNNRMVLQVKLDHVPASRRRTDRPTSVVVDLKLVECFSPDLGAQQPPASAPRTMIDIIIRSQRRRDRRGSALDSARGLLASIRSYLSAVDAPVEQGTAGGAPALPPDMPISSSSDEVPG